MDFLMDPSMKEIILDFCNETIGLIDELESILEELEEDPTQHGKLEKFGQIIDRIMGAAKSLALEEMANFCELGKAIGYQSGQVEDPALLNVVIAVL